MKRLQTTEGTISTTAEVQAASVPDVEAQALALRATGATLAEALRLALGFGADPCASRSLLSWADAEIRAAAGRWKGPTCFVSALDEPLRELLEIDPAFANAVVPLLAGVDVRGSLHLNGCAALKRLPERLWVDGNLSLLDCAALECLPDNLVVLGILNLRGCTALERLPKGLVVRSAVDMEGCSAWDGIVPEDARIPGVIPPDPKTQGGWLAGRSADGGGE